MNPHPWSGPASLAARLVSLAGALLVTAMVSGHPAPAEDGTEQRLTVTLVTLDMAQTACGYRPDRPRLAALLSSANVTREQLYARPITPALQAAIDGLRGRFQRAPADACAEAWRQYGPSSERALLTR